MFSTSIARTVWSCTFMKLSRVWRTTFPSRSSCSLQGWFWFVPYHVLPPIHNKCRRGSTRYAIEHIKWKLRSIGQHVCGYEVCLGEVWLIIVEIFARRGQLFFLVLNNFELYIDVMFTVCLTWWNYAHMFNISRFCLDMYIYGCSPYKCMGLSVIEVLNLFKCLTSTPPFHNISHIRF